MSSLAPQSTQTMRLPTLLATTLACCALIGSCATETGTVPQAIPASLRDDTPMDSNAVRLRVRGLGSPQSAAGLDRQLRALPGVETVTIDLGNGFVDVTLSPPLPSKLDLARTIVGAGFTIDALEER